MAVIDNGFAMPAMLSTTSDARRLSESLILAQKCSKHTMFLIILLVESLTAKSRLRQNEQKEHKNDTPKESVWCESGAHFAKTI